jgi:putative DNA primase/helicase
MAIVKATPILKLEKCQTVEVMPPQYSDEALALKFAEQHACNRRYVALLGKWYVFNGSRWVEDVKLTTIYDSRNICRSAAAECANLPIASRLASAANVYAVEKLARSDSRIAATIDQWDSDPWLLNTPAFTVDLRTGEHRPHVPSDYCTRQTAVSPSGTCPLWITFLVKTFAGDEQLIEYVQRVAGYALTGKTSEHAMFFCYGTGANGKSTMLNTLSGILGDYCAVPQIETFTASNTDRHPTEMAMLRGARIVIANETEEGRRWAEAKIKAVTSGDPITARQMRQDPFTFVPQFKLIMAGNHKPGLSGVDEAIRRRMNLIPFAVTIPENDRDPELFEKLKNEWPGILAWMIEGCLKWQKKGLQPPVAVQKATELYLESEDTLTLWTDECCEKEVAAWEKSSDLFDSWKEWADRAAEYVGSQKRFVQALEAKGFKQQRKNKGRGFLGVRLKEKDKKAALYQSMTLVSPNPVSSKNQLTAG